MSDGRSYTVSTDAESNDLGRPWHTVIGAFDGASVRLKVDGAEVGGAVRLHLDRLRAADSQDFFLGDYAPATRRPPS